MSKKKSNFDESLSMNMGTWRQYYNRLMELSMSMFEWKNLPPTVNERFLEMTLFSNGCAVFFEDKDIGYLALRSANNGPFDVYNIPVNRRAYAANGYQNQLTNKDSVLIYNNYIHTNSRLDVEMFAKRLYNLDRIIDVNANAQKTPILILCDETERLTMLNLYKEFDGNAPVIFGSKGLNTKGVNCLTTNAPYVADKIYDIKSRVWNEALTYLGISNMNIAKKERLITDEVTRNQGGTIASRYSRLQSRKNACDEINRMFGLNIDCEYRDDIQLQEPIELPDESGDENE